MFKWKFRTVVATLLLVVLSSCSKEDVSGKLDGVWQTEWDDILEGDLDEVRVKEILVFESSNQAGSEGEFLQIFTGDVDFDDWENESTVRYEVMVSGKWEVEDKDNVRLKYDLNTMSSSFGKSNVEVDYSDAALSMLQGDWGGMLVNAALAGNADKINSKIEAEVERQINKYFRDMFREINKDKEALTDVEIDDNSMTCSVNHGFLGREQTYDRVEKATPRSKEVAVAAVDSTYYDYDEDEGDELSDVINTYSLSGKIGGKYPIEMEITVVSNYRVTRARYRYTKTGSGAWIDLDIDTNDFGQTLMYESLNGQRVGCLEARLTCTGNSAELSGWHKNLKTGKELVLYAEGTMN